MKKQNIQKIQNTQKIQKKYRKHKKDRKYMGNKTENREQNRIEQNRVENISVKQCEIFETVNMITRVWKIQDFKQELNSVEYLRW